MSFVLIALILISTFSFSAFAIENEILNITENGNYVIDTSTQTPVIIDNVTGTISLQNAAISAEGQSAIKVMNKSNVTFNIVGTNDIKGDSTVCSCGIEVEYGSSITFEGNGELNVTGGKYGAAIGSFGTGINIPEEERVQVGEITIESGTINAYAGAHGAGIGAGYHVNGNLITINGGKIHAYGKECGAGIGCGYGTTGIDQVVYDTGKEHTNTLEDFRYNKPLESLSVNLPLGSTITAKAYNNYEYIGKAEIFISIDKDNPDRCYKDYYWEY